MATGIFEQLNVTDHTRFAEDPLFGSASLAEQMGFLRESDPTYINTALGFIASRLDANPIADELGIAAGEEQISEEVALTHLYSNSSLHGPNSKQAHAILETTGFLLSTSEVVQFVDYAAIVRGEGHVPTPEPRPRHGLEQRFAELVEEVAVAAALEDCLGNPEISTGVHDVVSETEEEDAGQHDFAYYLQRGGKILSERLNEQALRDAAREEMTDMEWLREKIGKLFARISRVREGIRSYFDPDDNSPENEARAQKFNKGLMYTLTVIGLLEVVGAVYFTARGHHLFSLGHHANGSGVQAHLQNAAGSKSQPADYLHTANHGQQNMPPYKNAGAEQAPAGGKIHNALNRIGAHARKFSYNVSRAIRLNR